jgi:prepilin-type N-terminal cleavage/methylation domain-containing protein
VRQAIKKSPIITRKKQGFTLIEVIVGLAIFAILLTGVMGAYSALARSVKVAREKITLASLSASNMEIVRNLPYSQIGTVNGNPPGQLPDLANARTATIESTTYKIYYEVTYMDDPADGTILAGTDPAPNDYKQVKMFILNNTTNIATSFVTNVSPKGLESLNNAGALLIKVFNAAGQPVSGANVHIENLALTPDIVLDRTTDSAGNWIEVGLPASVNGYHVIVTKNGFSTDQSYPISGSNPNPIKPDSTIVNGQVTQVSFAIDLVSTLTIKTQNQTCQNADGINLNLAGAKLIGTNPNVYKYSNNFTSSGGQVVINNLEWDTYTPVLLIGQSVMIYGTSPIQQISVLPGSSQTFTLVLGPTSANSLLAIVKDSTAALEGANVHLRNGDTSLDYYGVTGGSVWNQLSWTGGAGQADFTNATRYFNDDGNIDVNAVPSGVRLKKTAGNYAAAGALESSTFDTGAPSNFTTISWNPLSQTPNTVLQFQIASNNDHLTWTYKGPDGTPATYYTVPGSNINTVHDNDRYIRYKVFLATTDNQITPVLTDVSINYVAGCFTPGQVMFPSLPAGSNYTLDITLSGYQTQNLSGITVNGYATQTVIMSP